MSPRTRFTEIDSRQPVADDPAMAKSQGLFRSVWLWWGVTLAYWLTIFVLTHIPQQRVPKIGGGDKLAHLGAYLVLSYLIYISGWIQNPARRNWAIIVLAVIWIGGLYLAIRWRKQRNRFLALPFIMFGIWLATAYLGERFLGWTA